MSKLFPLKEWLTLEEAATHLSGVFGEPVEVADLLRFAISKHLKLSVNFVNHATAHIGRKVPFADAVFIGVQPVRPPYELNTVRVQSGGADEQSPPKPTLDLSERNQIAFAETLQAQPNAVFFPRGDMLSWSDVMEYEDQLTTLKGIWDLPMLGGERLDVEHLLQQLTGGPDVELVCLDGALVVSQDGMKYAKILKCFSRNPGADRKYPYDDPKSYFPSGLPNDAPMIVRTRALLEFIADQQDASAKSLTTRERETLLSLIGALCEVAGIDLRRETKGHAEAKRLAPELTLRNVKITNQVVAEKITAGRDLIAPKGPGWLP